MQYFVQYCMDADKKSLLPDREAGEQAEDGDYGRRTRSMKSPGRLGASPMPGVSWR